MRSKYSQLRFSRKKRFFIKISFQEFLRAATSLAELVREHRPDARVQVSTCEDRTTYNYSTVTFFAEEVIEALKNRKTYSLEDLTEDLWNRSFSLRVDVDYGFNGEPFAIHLEVDRTAAPKQMLFIGSCLSGAIENAVARAFRHRTMLYSIGDGFPKPSMFNFNFGQRITGISLR
jgi:hypothetical protein